MTKSGSGLGHDGVAIAAPVSELTPELIAASVVVFLVAGVIKGTVGIGLPTVSISLLSQFLDPRLAISLILLPVVISNAWQCVRSGQFVATFRRYGVMAVCLIVFIYLSASMAHRISTSTLTLIMGGAVVAFSALGLSSRLPRLPERWDRVGQIVCGCTAGVLGGITAIWGPPLILFLLARRVEKDDFIRAIGVLFTVGGLPLFVSFWQAGRFGGEIAFVSVLMVIPAIAGFFAGERLRNTLNAERFQTVLLVMFLFLGLNLVRRGLLL